MPELPEVETVKVGLQCLVGIMLRGVQLYRPDLRWPIPADRVANLAGRKVVRIERRAKYLLLCFSGADRPVALVHLGMSGRLFFGTASDPLVLHEHWRMDFGTRLLRFVDPRRFGMLDVVPTAHLSEHELLADLGPEPLLPAFDADYVHARTRKRKTPLKSWVMDAHEVVGVGNIYANEALFRAGLRPQRRAATITRADADRLVAAIRGVLSEAIAKGGTTIRDYVGAEQGMGYFQHELLVYDRAGEPCQRCAGTVKLLQNSARATYYCPRCQR